MISHDHLHHVGQYITAAANEASTELRSDVYRAHLPSDQDVRAQAEIAEFVWVQPAELLQPRGYQLAPLRSEEHTSELQSRGHLVCRLLLEKKKMKNRKE